MKPNKEDTKKLFDIYSEQKMKGKDFNAEEFIKESKELDKKLSRTNTNSKNYTIDSSLKHNEEKFKKVWQENHCRICGKEFTEKEKGLYNIVFGTPCNICLKCADKLRVIADIMFGRDEKK